jgi:hypothetical protein
MPDTRLGTGEGPTSATSRSHEHLTPLFTTTFLHGVVPRRRRGVSDCGDSISSEHILKWKAYLGGSLEGDEVVLVLVEDGLHLRGQLGHHARLDIRRRGEGLLLQS